MSHHFIVRSRTHLVSLHVPCNLIARVPLPLSKYSKALYLFTFSDLKTTLLPTTVFAYLSAQDPTVGRILCAVLWTWLHILQFCVSNQSMNPGEDALNKPWRPIPSGIVSVLNARILRWILLPLCLSLSISLGALWHSISLAIGFIVYNELHLDTHWLVRNACNAWGYASFNAGASAIAGQSTMTSRTLISSAVNALIIFSTIHVQDFRDEVGDKLMGRRTIPMVWPEGSRVWILVMLTAWSVGLSWACELAIPFSVPFCCLSLYVGLRFFRKRTADADRRSYHYYNIWLAAAQVAHIQALYQ
ncbi:UbiA prenyltransferase family domain containing protein [Russula decolorans]